MSTPEQEAPPNSILVVEDSAVFREMQQLLLGQAGYGVSAHASPRSALEIAEKQHFDLVIIDYELPEMNGQQFMHALRKIQPDIAVIFVSGSLTLELAIQLSSEGVAGVFNKPANPKILLEKVTETLARNVARDTAARVGSNNPLAGRGGGASSPFHNSATTEPTADRLAFTPRLLPGTSAVFRDFTQRIWKVRDFRSVLLLQGEPGSPFESLARDLAEISIFRDGPIMVCDAAAFDSRHLIEVLAPSLLSQDAGTLIVSGVETFSAEQQKTLHNLISGRDVFLPFARRFRLVLAASSRLSSRVDDGAFDETLYYKISSLSLAVPSLREMRSDIVGIARHLLAAQGGSESPDHPLNFTPDAAEWIEAQDWLENYDQLCRTVLGAIPHADNGQITSAALAAALIAPTGAPGQTPGVPAHHGTVGVPSRPNTRFPFPISSDLAVDATRQPVATTSQTADTTRPQPTPAAATAPASPPFARSAAKPLHPLAAKSVFRPAAANYEFAQRLEECLTRADSDNAA